MLRKIINNRTAGQRQVHPMAGRYDFERRQSAGLGDDSGMNE